MPKLRIPFYLVGLAGSLGFQFYGWWKNAGLIPHDQKFSRKWNLSFSQTIPVMGCPTYLASRLHRISSLFSCFWMFQNNILHKLLKLGFLNFSQNVVFIGCKIFCQVVMASQEDGGNICLVVMPPPQEDGGNIFFALGDFTVENLGGRKAIWRTLFFSLRGVGIGWGLVVSILLKKNL